MYDFMEPRKGMNVLRLVLVFLTVAILTVLHYSTATHHVEHHVLYRELYFIPIIMVSFWYGLREGLYFSLLVILLYTPHVVMTWAGQPGVNVGNLLQIVVFIIVAATTGYLSDREKKRQQEIREAQNLASLAKASLAMTSELRDVLSALKELLNDGDLPAGTHLRQSLKNVVDRITTLDHTLSHFTRGRSEAQKDFAEVDSSIERVKGKLKPLAKRSGVVVETRLQPSLGLLAINELDFVWMIEELTENAIESSTAGNTVTLASRWSEGQCEIEIRDQGIGIAPENLSKIFVPFYTTKEKGTGLSLAVCRKIMKDYDGEIRVKSKEAEGTSFVLVFRRIYRETRS
jgi:two-component system, NtrC family, sensor histidine kinase HydH